MLIRILKKFWWLLLALVGLLAGLITISKDWKLVCAFYLRLANKINQLISSPLCVIILIFVLSALNLIILTFYLLCKLKYSKLKNKNSYNIDENSEFVPTPDMVEVMLLMKNGIQLYRKQIHDQLTFEYDYTKYLIDTLEKECFLDVVLPNDLVDQLRMDRENMRLELSEPGRRYLVLNGLT